jgi:uncharacterized membrane protein
MTVRGASKRFGIAMLLVFIGWPLFILIGFAIGHGPGAIVGLLSFVVVWRAYARHAQRQVQAERAARFR